MHVYIESERNPSNYTVGHYAPSGEWIAESDHTEKGKAAERVHYLNGRNNDEAIENLKQHIAELLEEAMYLAKEAMTI